MWSLLVSCSAGDLKRRSRPFATPGYHGQCRRQRSFGGSFLSRGAAFVAGARVTIGMLSVGLGGDSPTNHDYRGHWSTRRSYQDLTTESARGQAFHKSVSLEWASSGSKQRLSGS